MMFVVLLPLIVATWQMPDPPADEDEFGDEAARGTVL